jgi:hypothetical protein
MLMLLVLCTRMYRSNSSAYDRRYPRSTLSESKQERAPAQSLTKTASLARPKYPNPLPGMSYHGVDSRGRSSGYVVLVAVDPLNPRSLAAAGTAGRLIGP